MDGVFRLVSLYLVGGVSGAVLLSLSACSGGSSDSDNFRPAVANPDSALIGAWEGLQCDVSESFSQTRSYVFKSDGTYDFTVNSFDNPNCSQPTFAISSSGAYFEGASGQSPDARDIVDLDIQQTTERSITPNNELSAETLNIDALCGRNDWQAGITQPIGGCQIGAIQDIVLPTLYRVYHIQDNQFLYFSNELSFSPENRSLALQTRPIVVRQLPASADFGTQISGLWRSDSTGMILEFRDNGIFYSYTPNDNTMPCFDLTTDAALKFGEGSYRTFSGQDLTIVADGNELQFSEPASGSSLQFSLLSDIDSGQLLLCAAQPSG